MAIGAATTVNHGSGGDGIIGFGNYSFITKRFHNVGFNLDSNIGQALGPTAATNLFDALSLPAKIMGMERHQLKDGMMTLGGIDTSVIQGTPVMYPLVKNNQNQAVKWQFKPQSASFTLMGTNLKNVPLTMPILSDTGNSGISLPLQLYNQIANILKINQDGYVNCNFQNNGPNLYFQIDGRGYTVTPKNYIVKIKGGMLLIRVN